MVLVWRITDDSSNSRVAKLSCYSYITVASRSQTTIFLLCEGFPETIMNNRTVVSKPVVVSVARGVAAFRPSRGSGMQEMANFSD